MYNNEVFFMYNSVWEFFLYVIIFIVLLNSQSFKGKNWLILISVCWIMKSILSVLLSYDRVSYGSLADILPSDVLWANNLLANSILLPAFFLTVWGNKYLNINGDLFFSLQGRIPRSIYLMVSFLNIGIFSYVLIYLLDELDSGVYYLEITTKKVYWLCILLLQTWFTLAISIKRWHDHDKSAWFVLISFIPVVGNLITFVVLGFLRGTNGANRFGDDTLKLTRKPVEKVVSEES